MAYRCPDCNRFVSTTCKPELESLDLDQENGIVSAQVRLVLECAECGLELAECTVEGEDEFTLQLELMDDCPEPEEHGKYSCKIPYQVRSALSSPNVEEVLVDSHVIVEAEPGDFEEV